MWVYIAYSDTEFETGFFGPDKSWYKDERFSAREQARMRVHYLNGGSAEGSITGYA